MEEKRLEGTNERKEKRGSLDFKRGGEKKTNKKVPENRETLAKIGRAGPKGCGQKDGEKRKFSIFVRTSLIIGNVPDCQKVFLGGGRSTNEKNSKSRESKRIVKKAVAQEETVWEKRGMVIYHERNLTSRPCNRENRGRGPDQEGGNAKPFTKHAPPEKRS